jgi:putative membrane protein
MRLTRVQLAAATAVALLGAAGALPGSRAFAQGMTDRQFVADAIRGDIGEMEIGQLAQTRAATPGVRSFGKTLESDHAEAKAQMTTLAHSLGIVPPTQTMPAAKKEYEKLAGLRGAAFDAEFLRAMVEGHDIEIQRFQAEAKSGNGPVAAMAAKQLPMLQKHLITAQTLEKQALTP